MVIMYDVNSFIKLERYSSLFIRTILTLPLNANDEDPINQMFNIETNMINKTNIALDRLIIYIKLKLLIMKDGIDKYNDMSIRIF